MAGRKPTSQSVALQALRRALASGQLRPGDQIRQEHVAEQLGISSIPVREALRSLQYEGQVVYEPHRGNFVAEFSWEELQEVQQLRELIEEALVPRAVERLSAAEIAAMEGHERAARAAASRADVASLLAASEELHFALLGASGQGIMGRHLRMAWNATSSYRALAANDPRRRQAVLAAHAELVEAARRYDAEELARVLAREREAELRAIAAILHVERDGEPA